jgi:hypothetical protein
VTQTGNRYSYGQRGIPPAQDHAPDTDVRNVLSTTARKNTICVPRWQHDKTAYKSNGSYKGPPEVCGAKSHRAIALGTTSVRASKNPSDSNTALDHTPTQGFRQHFGCPKRQKCHKGKQISIKGRLRYPKEGRTAQATDPRHPNHDMFNDGRESEETALCSVGRTKSAGSPTSRASPEQLMRRHSPRHTAPAPTTPPSQAKMTRRQPMCRST